MMTTQLDEFKQALFEAKEKVREGAPTIEVSINNPLIWFFLLPGISIKTANLTQFPTVSNLAVKEYFEDLTNSGYLERFDSLNFLGNESEPEVVELFCMTGSSKSRILSGLRNLAGYKLALQQVVQEIAEKLIRVSSLEARLADWAFLMNAHNSEIIGLNLTEKVDACIRNKDSAGAIKWIELASSATVIFPEIQLKIDSCSRSLELFHRREIDSRHLASFLERSSQIDMVLDLVSPIDDNWALHFRGDGGVGKTMLARYISSKLAFENGWSVARIDFDYLNPNYPTKAPGLLLENIARELMVFGRENDLPKSLLIFLSDVQALHKRIEQNLSTDHSAMAQTGELSEEFIKRFADGLADLPSPVILLDTCEELEKSTFWTGLDDEEYFKLNKNVENMLSVFCKIHKRHKSFRLILLGRRRLTQYNQRLMESPISSALNMKEFEIKPFDSGEACRYLENRRVEPSFVEPILARCKLASEPLQRFNPFELDFYASWVNTDKEITSKAIANSDTDPYIERRILHRIRNATVRAAVPTLALLRKFDRVILERIFDELTNEEFTLLFDEVCRQEWLTTAADGSYEIVKGIDSRLLDYFRRADGAQFGELKRRLVDKLSKAIASLPLNQLDKNIYIVLFNLVEDVETTIDFLVKVTEKFLRENNPRGLLGVLQLLSAQYSSRIDERKDDLVATYLLLSFAVASIHINDRESAQNYWTSLGDRIRHLENVSEHIVSRIKLGAFAAQRNAFSVQELEDWTAVVRKVTSPIKDEQLVASAVAGIESYLERLEFASQRYSKVDDELLATTQRIFRDEKLQPSLRIYSQCLSIRIIAQTGTFAQVGRLKQLVGDLLIEADRIAEDSKVFFDWQKPSDLYARILLEALFASMSAEDFRPREIQRLFPSVSVVDVGTIDGDRYFSLLMQLWARCNMDIGQPPQHEVSADQKPTCRTHRLVAPSTVMFWFLSARGFNQPIESLDRLIEFTQGVVGSDEEPIAKIHAKRAITTILRDMRHLNSPKMPILGTVTGRDLELFRLSKAVEGLRGHEIEIADYLQIPDHFKTYPTSSLDDGNRVHRHVAHSVWRSFFCNDAPSRKTQGLEWAQKFFESDVFLQTTNLSEYRSVEVCHCWLDLLEKHIVVNGSEFEFARWRIEIFGKGIRHLNAVDSFTLRLRWRTLAKRDVGEFAIETSKFLGAQLVADVALDEGEMLALRLPTHAQPLLLAAFELYKKAEDWPNALRSYICWLRCLRWFEPPDQVKLAASELQSTYFEAQKASRLLPYWNQLFQETYALSVDNYWFPWLARLKACIDLPIPNGTGVQQAELVKSVLADSVVPEKHSSVEKRHDLESSVDKSTVLTLDCKGRSYWEEEYFTSDRVATRLSLHKNYEEGEFDCGKHYNWYRNEFAKLFSAWKDRFNLADGNRNLIKLRLGDLAQAAPCWEYFIANFLYGSAADAIEDRRLCSFVRTMEQLPEYNGILSDPYGSAVVLCANVQIGFEIAIGGWGNSKWKYEVPELRSGDGIRAIPRNASIVHIIGVPMSGGYLMLDRDDRSTGGIYPDRIAKLLDSVPLIVLQEPPTHSSDGQGDRLGASRMRFFAASLLRYGVPNVLVLPAINFATVQTVIRILAEQLSMESVTLREFLDAIFEIRSKIWQGFKSDESTERAYDVSFFTRYSYEYLDKQR